MVFAFFDRGESQAQSFSTSCEKCPKGRGLCGEDMMSCSGSKHGRFLGSPSDSSSRIISCLRGPFSTFCTGQSARCQVCWERRPQITNQQSRAVNSLTVYQSPALIRPLSSLFVPISCRPCLGTTNVKHPRRHMVEDIMRKVGWLVLSLSNS